MPLIITAITISWINPSVINEIIIIYSSNAFLVILLHQIKWQL
jgi:hypothetical protein